MSNVYKIVSLVPKNKVLYQFFVFWKKNLKQSLNQTYNRFLRLKNKYDKQVSSGKFELLSKLEQSKVIKRLHKAIQELAGLKLHIGKTATLTAFTGLMSIAANAQDYIEITGADSPIDGINASSTSHPIFVDIDGDGDLDFFMGYSNQFRMYENTGTAADPIFNPSNTIVFANVTNSDLNVNVELVDLDDDGFLEAVNAGESYFWEHENAETTPIDANTFSTSASYTSSMGESCGGGQATFADLDDDGDLDFIYGNGGWNSIKLVMNEGTPSIPSWATPVTLLDGSGPGWSGSPELYDYDGDGDFDLLVGMQDGTINYYENQGTVLLHNFVQKTGTDNPFNLIDIGNVAFPTLADLNDDGEPELILGGLDIVKYYELICTDDATTQVESACTTFDWIDGNTYTSSNNEATYTLTNATGCDSVVTLDLTIGINVSTTTTNYTITANNTAATSYQWLDAANAPIDGETNVSYTATENGDYSVIVTNGNCSDTSDVVTIAGLGISNAGRLGGVEIYPNPTQGTFNISTLEKDVVLTVYGLDGKVVIDQLKLTKQNQLINLDEVEKGIYFVKVSNTTGEKTVRLVIE